jgi:hypothetical protein
MALQDHATVSVILDGNPLENITSCELTTNSGEQRVDVLKQGLAGFTPGSGDCTISLGYTIPIGGTEYPYQEKCANKEYVTAQVGRGNRDYVGTGKIMTCTESESVGGAMEGRMEWTGELKPYK